MTPLPPPANADWATIERYLTGECSDEDTRYVRTLLDHPSGDAFIRIVAERLAAGRPDVARVDQAVARLQAARGALAPAARTRGASTGVDAPPGTKGRWTLPRVVMAGAVGAAIAAVMMVGTHGTSPERADSRTYRTASAQRATVRLDGGSEIILAPGTTVSLRTTDREGTVATVEGQALFSIAHSGATPFSVRTGNAIARVLGTKFLVRQYATDRAARIVVADGRVSVQSTRAGADTSVHIVLTAGILAAVNDSGQVAITPQISVSEYTGWTTGDLVFHATRVRDVLADLARAYDVDIALSDTTLANRKIDWNVRTSRYSLSEVLPELLIILNAHALESGKGIIIAPGRAASRTIPIRSSFTKELYYGR